MVRRSVAAGAGLLVLLLLLLGFKGCLDARKEGAFADYVGDIGILVDESNQQSEELFGLLTDPKGASEVEIENRLNGFRAQADELVDRTIATEAPDELKDAHEYLVETFRFRRDGVAAIADELPKLLPGEGDRAAGTEKIAGSMLSFATSDVLYDTRFRLRVAEAFEAEELAGERATPESDFLPDISFLQPEIVSDRIRGLGGGGGGPDEEAAPGLHGNGLEGVSLGGQALSPDGSASIALSEEPQFEIQVANQGENTETDVQVSVTVGEGGDAIELDKMLDEIAAGETKTVAIPLTEQPPTGQNVPITVDVAAVPGEEKTDNNSGEFSAIFTR